MRENIRANRLRELKESIELYRQYLAPGSSAIDIGCGDGLAARLIKDQLSLDITCLDIDSKQFQQQSTLDLVVADASVKIPFPDESFDAAFLFYTLHHCKKPYNILKEAARVVRHHIIVIEEFYESKINKILMNLYDGIINRILYPGNDMPPNFMKAEEMFEFAENLGLSLEKDYCFERRWYRPPHKRLLVFRKSN